MKFGNLKTPYKVTVTVVKVNAMQIRADDYFFTTSLDEASTSDHW